MNRRFIHIASAVLVCVLLPGFAIGDGKSLPATASASKVSLSDNAGRQAFLDKITADIAAKIKLSEATVQKLQNGDFKLNPQEEDALGMLIAAPVFAVAPIVDKPETQLRLNKLIQRIGAQTERPDINWRGALIESPEINAYSAPGGIILITSSLYELLENEEELAGIIAHEAVHIVKQHHMENLEKSMKTAKWTGGLATAIGFVEDLAHKSAMKNDPRYAAKNFGKENPKLLSNLIGNFAEGYTRGLDRDAELEADRMGVVYMARAGFDPFAYISALQKLEGLDNHNLAAQQLFKTHPAANSRIEALEHAIGNRFDGLPMQRMQSGNKLVALYPSQRLDHPSTLDGVWEMEFRNSWGQTDVLGVMLRNGILDGMGEEDHYTATFSIDGKSLKGNMKTYSKKRTLPRDFDFDFEGQPGMRSFYVVAWLRKEPETKYLVLFKRK